jgi:hypothetical protein
MHPRKQEFLNRSIATLLPVRLGPVHPTTIDMHAKPPRSQIAQLPGTISCQPCVPFVLSAFLSMAAPHPSPCALCVPPSF